MIAFLEGIVHSIDDHQIVVLIAGIGYELHVPLRLLEHAVVDEHIALHTYQHVREDVLDLYGFRERDERDFFVKLLQVSGVGPRLALAALSAFPLNELKRAIVHGDIATLQEISGVGQKTAQRIALDLKESIDILATTPAVAGEENTPSATALEALLSLGYNRNEALNALRTVDATLPLEEQVRAALKHVRSSR